MRDLFRWSASNNSYFSYKKCSMNHRNCFNKFWPTRKNFHLFTKILTQNLIEILIINPVKQGGQLSIRRTPKNAQEKLSRGERPDAVIKPTAVLFQ